MNTPINDGGTAFPVLERGGNGLELTSLGMSLRDYFAAKFAHAEMMTCGVPGEACKALITATRKSGLSVEMQVATNAYQLADAMLKARQS